MIKLIAIDLDGTLLTSEKTISERNKKALKQAKALGVKIVICTGRPLAAIKDYLLTLNLLEEGDYSITFNGGLVQKNDTGEIIEKVLLPFADIKDIYQLGKTLELPIDVLSNGTVYHLPSSEEHPSIYHRLNGLLTFQPLDLDQLSEVNEFNKAVVAIEETYLDEQIKKIPDEFYQRFEVIKTRSNLLEFMPKGITKAYGVSLLAKDLSIDPKEMMAIGDEENDLSMLVYAGLGVAMNNAVEKVKTAANIVTKSNDQDGVAQVIEDYVLQAVEGGE